jgi:sterol O-acyltransferase
MGHFVYFLFAPTVIYRDCYPRSSGKRRWKRVFFLSLFLLSLVFIGLKLAVATSQPLFESEEEGLPLSLIVKVLPMVIFTTLYTVLVGVGVAFIDVWCSIFAEILRFGDRGFYAEWWTQHDILQFLIKWNNINQNWLFEYIYEPFRQKHGKQFAGLAVMAVSGFFHDYIFVSTFSIFLPICSGGQITSWILSRFVNERQKLPAGMTPQGTSVPSLITFMGSTYNFFGFAIVYLFCLLEYYSRRHCPIQDNTFMSFVTPRLFYCLEWN